MLAIVLLALTAVFKMLYFELVPLPLMVGRQFHCHKTFITQMLQLLL
jgi:hypothetical protein